ncbi:unnamed protein product [Echinostoma caproni]|uniref:Uncharacterized protein n=1 Tax=Echinostoma caproni TaxID=27848 RepID=A0A183AJF1_9TREM|nr:unnamed protein product [Echinostoma caproni]
MDSPHRGLPGIIYRYDSMDSQLVELAENIKQRGRDGAFPLFKETGSEFVMPKFPIERKEMESHILELRMSRDPIKVAVSLPSSEEVTSELLSNSVKRNSGFGSTFRTRTFTNDFEELSGGNSVPKSDSVALDSEALASSIWRLISVPASPGASGEVAQVFTAPHHTTSCPQPAEIDPLLREEESAVEANIESAAVEFQRVQICGEDTLDVSFGLLNWRLFGEFDLYGRSR